MLNLLTQCGALNVHIRGEAVQPLRHPPRLIAQQSHNRRGQRHAHDERIHQHTERQAEAHRANHGRFSEDEAAKHRNHDDRGSHHHAHRVVIATHNGGRRVLTVHVCFTHAGYQEHLVIHGKAKENTDEQGRQEGQHRARVVHPEEGTHEAQLVNRHDGTEACQHREKEAHRGNQRNQNRAEHQDQHQEGQAHHHTQVQG